MKFLIKHKDKKRFLKKIVMNDRALQFLKQKRIAFVIDVLFVGPSNEKEKMISITDECVRFDGKILRDTIGVRHMSKDMSMHSFVLRPALYHIRMEYTPDGMICQTLP